MQIAVIGGTGFGAALVDGAPETISTEYGPAALTRADLGNGRDLLFLARHGAGHSLPPHRINHRANIAALRDLGADAVFATTAVGSLRPEIHPGDFVILDDFLDMTKGEVVTFYGEPGGVRHTDFVHPYDPYLREILQNTAGAELTPRIHAHGTYLCTSGPRYETPAEVRLFGQWGASVVGMTGAPEADACAAKPACATPELPLLPTTARGCCLPRRCPMPKSNRQWRQAGPRLRRGCCGRSKPFHTGE